MSYEPTIWRTGDTVTAEKLNKIEQAIATDNTAIEGKVGRDEFDAEIATLESKVGSPLIASTVSEMTETDRVYVYTGSETGYTSGNWYYYDGTAWTSGGVYNAVAVQTDKTLTVQDKAADGKATGDALNALKEDLNILRPSATSADVGKALIVKTVADGVPTEFEYGEAGSSVELDDTLTSPTKAAQAKAVGDALIYAESEEQTDLTSELVTGGYYQTNGSIGSTVSNTRVSYSGYSSKYFAVTAGEKYILTGTGANGGRLWCFTDSTYKILSNSASNATATDLELTVSADGYLFINVADNKAKSFKKVVSVKITVKDAVEDLAEEVGNVEETLSGMNDFGTKTLIEDCLEGLEYGYYATNGSAGSVISTTRETEWTIVSKYMPVSKDDVYVITGKGGSIPRLWCFTDSEYKIISSSYYGVTETNKEITASSDGYLFVNFSRSNAYALDKKTVVDVTIPVKFDGIDDDLDDTHDSIDFINTVDAVTTEVDITDQLIRGGYFSMARVGDIVVLTKQSYSTAASEKFAVSKGDRFRISTGGGEAIRAYAFTNSYYKILELAESGGIYGRVIEAPQDGYLFVNVITSSSPKLIKYNVTEHTTILEKFRDVDSRFNTLGDFRGLKYCALGDSITYGFCPRNYEGYGEIVLKSYAELSANKLGMTFVNYGVSGSRLSNYDGVDPMCVRYANMPDDADIVSVMGGTNDIRHSVPLGQMSDRVDTTFYGALHALLGGLYKKYFIDQGTTEGKKKKVIVCTPIKLLSTYASEQGGTGTLVNFEPWIDAIKEVSAYYSFPVCDFYNNSGINPHLNQTIQGYTAGYMGFYNPYITDGTHPTQEGQQIMADYFCGFLRSLK